LGHNEFLRFPNQSYYLDDVYLIEDPFDLALGAVDVRTGAVIGDMLHRCFIGQNLFFALVRVEPRTPKESFRFRGPAALQCGPSGALSFQFKGTLKIPYPAGFLFPDPNLSTGTAIGPDSQLDPYVEIVAFRDASAAVGGKVSGRIEEGISSTGTPFTFEYDILDGGRKGRFKFRDNLQNSEFQMHPNGISAVTVHRAGRGGKSPDCDMITFTGLGTWSGGPHYLLQTATVQVSADPNRPYVSVMIDSGRIANVNVRPRVTGRPES
jgi:hypothetical protein